MERQTNRWAPCEQTEWHRISLFNKLGEIAAQYLRKGSQVYIEGSLRTNKYTDQNGVERYATEIRADQMQMLGTQQAAFKAVFLITTLPAQPTKTSPKVVIINVGYNQGGNQAPNHFGGYPNQNNALLRHKRVKMQDLAITHLWMATKRHKGQI